MQSLDPGVAGRKRARVPSKKLRKAAPARAPPGADDDGSNDAFTIPQFCRRYTISISFWHKLRRQGLTPKTMKIGSRVAISREAAEQWRREREAA